jgi:hypothetical protein
MATTSKRNKPSRTPTAAVLIDAKQHNEAIKTLREISKRGARVADQMIKTYDEVECIAQTVDALACKIGDGSMNSKQIIAALEKIESRLHSQFARFNEAELNISIIVEDAQWAADGNINDQRSI